MPKPLSFTELRNLAKGTPVIVKGYRRDENGEWQEWQQPTNQALKICHPDRNSDVLLYRAIVGGFDSTLSINPVNLTNNIPSASIFYQVTLDPKPLAGYSYGEVPSPRYFYPSFVP